MINNYNRIIKYGSLSAGILYVSIITLYPFVKTKVTENDKASDFYRNHISQFTK